MGAAVNIDRSMRRPRLGIWASQFGIQLLCSDLDWHWHRGGRAQPGGARRTGRWRWCGARAPTACERPDLFTGERTSFHGLASRWPAT